MLHHLRATAVPHFLLYRNGLLVAEVTGLNFPALERALAAHAPRAQATDPPDDQSINPFYFVKPDPPERPSTGGRPRTAELLKAHSSSRSGGEHDRGRAVARIEVTSSICCRRSCSVRLPPTAPRACSRVPCRPTPTARPVLTHSVSSESAAAEDRTRLPRYSARSAWWRSSHSLQRTCRRRSGGSKARQPATPPCGGKPDRSPVAGFRSASAINASANRSSPPKRRHRRPGGMSSRPGAATTPCESAAGGCVLAAARVRCCS